MSAPRINDAPAISTVELTKFFGRTCALQSLSLTVPRGEVFGLLGPNGAGKTTMIRLLLGLLKPTRGDAKLFGLSAWSDVRQVHANIAYVPGDFRVWPQLTGQEMLQLLGSTHFDIDNDYQKDLCNKFDFDVSKKGRSYSKGNRQKVILISAFASRAELLILDEPTSGLDPLMEDVFQHCVREAKSRGQTVLMSSHILSEVEAACDRVGILRSGQMVECGTIDSLAHLHALSYEVTWQGAAPQLHRIDGVTQLQQRENSAAFRFEGNTSVLLNELASVHVTRLESRQPTLEELFLTLYQGETR